MNRMGGFITAKGPDIVYYYLSEKDRKAVGSPDVDRAAFAVSQSKMIITLLHAADTPPYSPLLGGTQEVKRLCPFMPSVYL